MAFICNSLNYLVLARGRKLSSNAIQSMWLMWCVSFKKSQDCQSGSQRMGFIEMRSFSALTFIQRHLGSLQNDQRSNYIFFFFFFGFHLLFLLFLFSLSSEYVCVCVYVFIFLTNMNYKRFSAHSLPENVEIFSLRKSW